MLDSMVVGSEDEIAYLMCNNEMVGSCLLSKVGDSGNSFILRGFLINNVFHGMRMGTQLL